MKIILSLFASASLLITTSVASVAEPEKTITIIDLASKYCAAEWTGVIELDPDAWKKMSELPEPNPTPDLWAKHIVQELGSEHTGPEHSVPAMDVATTEAFEKYQTVLAAILDFLGVSARFSATANQNPDYFNLASAKFDLMLCLLPTEAERDLIVDFSKTTTSASDAAIRAELFEGFDIFFECLQFAEAYKAIFSFESLPSDWEAIFDGYMKDPSECE